MAEKEVVKRKDVLVLLTGVLKTITDQAAQGAGQTAEAASKPGDETAPASRDSSRSSGSTETNTSTDTMRDIDAAYSNMEQSIEVEYNKLIQEMKAISGPAETIVEIVQVRKAAKTTLWPPPIDRDSWKKLLRYLQAAGVSK
jgi:hypothetical protein